MTNETTHRMATPADVAFIVEMVDLATDGVALVEWTDIAAGTDRSPLDVAAGIYAAEDGDYSYRNCVIAEYAGRAAGVLLAFPMRPRDPGDTPLPPPFDGTDVFAPYKYLEAPNSWYVCSVAVREGLRGRGIGNGLMEHARQQAIRHGFDRLSLLVFEQNAHAVRLYRRLGYQVIARAPVVPHPLIRYTGGLLLMVAGATATSDQVSDR